MSINTTTFGNDYETPAVVVIDIHAENMIAASNEKKGAEPDDWEEGNSDWF